MSKVMQLLGLIVLIVLGIWLDLFVLTKIWALTVVPLGAHAIGLPQAWGIKLFVNACTPDKEREEDKKPDIGDSVSKVVRRALSMLLLWGIAYLFFGA